MITNNTVLESSFKIQCIYVEQYAKEYMRAKLNIANYQFLKSTVREQDLNYNAIDLKKEINYSYLKNYVTYIDNILSMLDSEQQYIIKKEFFGIKTKNWWISDYSRSTFYRLKRKAVTQFLMYAS